VARLLGLFVLVALMATACGDDEAATDRATSMVQSTATASSYASPTTQPSSSVAPTATATTATSKPTATSEPPPPVLVVLPGYEAAVVRTVCVEVNDSYPGIEGGDKPSLGDEVTGALEAMGLVVADIGQGCDATLTFDLEGRALSEQYSSDTGAVTYYTGAAYDGTAEFAVASFEPVRNEVSGRLDPPFMISDSRPDQTDAPFEAAFVEPMLTTLSQVWGPVVVIETIEVWPQGDFFDTLASGGADWIVNEAPEILPDLLELRLSSSFRISERAYFGLAEIVANDAVPAADQSRIVRTLIDDMSTPEHFAGEALRLMANAPYEGRAVAGPLPGYFEDIDSMILGPWDEQAWTEWADANGY